MSTASDAKPHILLLMADQLSAGALPAYGNKVVKAPHLSALGKAGVVFDRAYCNSPICAPSRFSLLSGRLPTKIKAFDNASEFPASIPTIAHYLCSVGYRTILSGKMHFIGPDQLHGFEERLTTDIYPSDFTWTPNWSNGPRDRPSGISMLGVREAGPCVRTLQMDYDDEVEFQAIQKIYDLAREPDRQPFFLTASFSHPHSPFTIHTDYWNRYSDEEIDEPHVSEIPFEERDVLSQWLQLSHLADREPVSASQMRAARRAYYGMVSYIDDKIGRILKTLEETRLMQETIVVFCSDHGEMLGERGMWYKQNFFEPSARVPLIIASPGRFKPKTVSQMVSLVDLMPTLMDIVSPAGETEFVDPIDGSSLLPQLNGAADNQSAIAISEYTDMGVCAPCRMIRKGRYKYIYIHGQKAQLYDLESDPLELSNLVDQPDMQEIARILSLKLLENWGPAELNEEILSSQRRRLFLKEVTSRSERAVDWSYQAFRDDKKRFVRGAGATRAKALARFPQTGQGPGKK
jgi:choline-sulfatase